MDTIRYVSPQDWFQQEPLGTVVVPRLENRGMWSPGQTGSELIGAAVCGECHRDRYKDFQKTNHFLTSREAHHRTLKGSFARGRNRLLTTHEALQYEMQAGADGYYQAVLVDGEEVHRERIDIVMGSGKMAQTYLYWKDDALFQLPVSYFTTTDSWVDSPGYPDGIALFSRPVLTGCLECHTTYFSGKYESHGNYRYDRENYLLGVSCERCHGPGREHVNYHRQHPDTKTGKRIVHPGKLARDRLNDICAQCHSTQGEPLRPPFKFRPGEPLANYFRLAETPAAAEPGIHTNNQLQRLRLSACFQKSPEMSCATCHDPHKKESGDHTLFSKRCLECHRVEDCGMSGMESIRHRCVECHMTKHEVIRGVMRSTRGSAPIMMWDHFIRVDANSSQ